ncbi:MAG: L,D-transpeptidase family protein [Bacteroidota bacterium]
MKFPLCFILLIFGLYSCSQKPDLPKKIIPGKGIRTDFALNFKENFQDVNSENSKILDSFYSINSLKPLWLNDSLQLNKDGIEFLYILANAKHYGLDPKKYSIEEIQELKLSLEQSVKLQVRIQKAVSLEKILTQSYFIFGKHLNYGVIDSVELFSTIPRKPFTVNLPDYLRKAYLKDSVIPYLLKLQPENIYYHKLQKSMANYLKSASFSKEKVRVDNYKIDSVKSYEQAKEALVIHGYISESSNDTSLIRGLKKFQYDHGLKSDGVIGKYSARALSKSPYEYYQHTVVSLERWRWKPMWKEDYIYVNIPAYKLRLHLGDTIHEKHNVVVGTYYNRTPEVYSKLSYLVAYPYWHVPRSISVKEILVHAKKDSTYITKNNYEIFSKNLDSISPNSIDWDTINDTNFNYYIRQKGGPSNALGLVKFIFANRYSIYLHDTPTKYHFFREIRSYSHGCIRVQDAINVADNILKYDENEYTIDSVYAYVERREEKLMMLENKIPVYVHYITCEADENGNIIFYPDIYKKDENLISMFFKE